MRASGSAVAVSLLLAACGSTPSTSVPAENVPASLVIQAGDVQEAAPGAAVAVPPSVIVKNAAGHALAGIVVTFLVSSGGGAVSGGAVTTGNDGTATCGSWTLGPQEGANTLGAQVAGLAAVTFHAQARSVSGVVADTTLGAGGGTIRITGTGSAYAGLELTIPSGAFSGAGQWTFRVDPTMTAPQLPAGVIVTSPPLVITTDQGRATRLLTMRLPITRQAGYTNAAVLYDPQRGVLEALPMFGGDATSLLIGTTHLNAGLIAGRPAGSSLEPHANGGFGSLLLNVQIPDGALRNINLTGFGQGLDAFGIAEMGSYLFPDGHGPASAILTIVTRMLGGTSPLGTLSRPASIPGFHLDSVTLAAVTVIARRYQSDGLQIAPVFNDIGVILSPLPPFRRDSLTNVNLRVGMFVSNLPQLMLYVKNMLGSTFPQSQVSFTTVFGATETGLNSIDPTRPAAVNTVGIEASGFVSRLFKNTGDAAPQSAEAILPLGNSFLFPLEQFTDVVRNLLSRGNALLAEAGLPPITVELRNGPGLDWTGVSDAPIARAITAEIRARCASCPGALPFADDPQIQEMVAVNPDTRQEAARSLGGSLGMSVGGMLGPLGAVIQLLGGTQARMAGPGSGQVSRMLVPIRMGLLNSIVTLSPGTQAVELGAEASFAVHNALPGAGGVIEWKFGDETATETGAPRETTKAHVYAREGTFDVEATLLMDGKRIVTAKSTVTVTDPNKWHLTSLAGSAAAWSPVSVGQSYQQSNAFFELLKNTPGKGAFVLNPATRELKLTIDPPPQGLPAQAVLATTAASECDVPNSSTVTGTSSTGSISGTSVQTCAKATNRSLSSVVVTLASQKSGDRLTGTIQVRFTDFNGHTETEFIPPKVVTKFYIDNILETRTVTWTFVAARGGATGP